jgi:two-component system, cell cycle sensor histidine kinase and response regulator CckA
VVGNAEYFMAETLRVLILEDHEEDLQLMLRELRNSGFEPEWLRVQSEEGLIEALIQPWDVILSDYVMPNFNAAQALRIVQDRGIKTPFIVVSGNIGEEVAVATMKLGASDYLLKDRLSRLGPAVSNALVQEQLTKDAERARQSLDASLTNQRNLEQQQADILDSLPANIAVLDRESNILRVNRGWEEWEECHCFQKSGEPLHRNYLNICAAAAAAGNAYAQQAAEGIRGVLDQSLPSFELEYPCRSNADQQRWFRLMVTPLRGAGVERIVVMNVDTTDLIHAKEANRRLAAILEATPDFVGLVEPDGQVLYVNRSGRELVGITSDDLASGAGRITQFHPPWAADVIWNVGIPHAKEHGMWNGETAMLHRQDGREIPVSQVILAHRTASGEVAYLSTIARDITQQRLLEEQMRQSQKMEAVGRLAGGIAHDFNNILTIILGYSELMEENLGREDSNLELVQGISEAARRAAVLTRQLLAFSRKQILRPRVINLNTSVTEMEKILGRLLGEDVEFLTRLEEGLPDIKADPSQVEQVILHLAVNARDAMPDGGQLFLQTRGYHTRDHQNGRPADLPEGAYVELTIRDTGNGMDPHTVQHIFEPFFTTKAPGKGTGLGLAMVYGTVKQSDGYIEVESEPGAGTRFRIFFPVHDRSTEAASSPSPPASDDLQECTATLLLVEDDESVRRLARYALQLQGYHILEAANGAEALHISGSFQEPIDLLLTDMVMPRMSGRELADELLAQRPQLKVVYMSGYSGDVRVHEHLAKITGSFLQKPFTPAALLTKVREVLSQ